MKRFWPTIVAILGAGAFAANDLCFRSLGGRIDPYLMLLLANGAYGVATGGYLALRKEGVWPKRMWAGLLLAVIRALTILLAILGLKELPVSQYYLVLYLFPVWVMALGGVFLGEIPRKLQVGGLALALVGVGLVFQDGSMEWGKGTFYTLGCSITLAAQILLSRALKEESFVKLGFLNAVVGCVLAGVMLGIYPAAHDTSWVGLWQAWAVVGLGVLAPLMMLYANQRLKAFAYALLSYMQIPLALMGAWLFLGEEIGKAVVVGLVLVTLGSLASQLPDKKRA